MMPIHVLHEFACTWYVCEVYNVWRVPLHWCTMCGESLYIVGGMSPSVCDESMVWQKQTYMTCSDKRTTFKVPCLLHIQPSPVCVTSRHQWKELSPLFISFMGWSLYGLLPMFFVPQCISPPPPPPQTYTVPPPPPPPLADTLIQVNLWVSSKGITSLFSHLVEYHKNIMHKACTIGFVTRWLSSLLH